MTGPYKVEHLKRNGVLADRWRVHGPGVNNTYGDDEEAADIADDLNLSHRAAIEQAIGVVANYAANHELLHDLRALLTPPTKENDDAE